jgi:hypothetical protein
VGAGRRARVAQLRVVGYRESTGDPLSVRVLSPGAEILIFLVVDSQRVGVRRAELKIEI